LVHEPGAWSARQRVGHYLQRPLQPLSARIHGRPDAPDPDVGGWGRRVVAREHLPERMGFQRGNPERWRRMEAMRQNLGRRQELEPLPSPAQGLRQGCWDAEAKQHSAERRRHAWETSAQSASAKSSPMEVSGRRRLAVPKMPVRAGKAGQVSPHWMKPRPRSPSLEFRGRASGSSPLAAAKDVKGQPDQAVAFQAMPCHNGSLLLPEGLGGVTAADHERQVADSMVADMFAGFEDSEDSATVCSGCSRDSDSE